MRNFLLIMISLFVMLLSVHINNQTFIKGREIVKLKDERDYWLSKYYEAQVEYVRKISVLKILKKYHGHKEAEQSKTE